MTPLHLNPEISTIPPLIIEKEELAMLRGKKSVWVTWKEARQRWEVGFWWEGKQKKYYSWEFQGQKWIFTKQRKEIAEEFASHIRSLMRPKNGICTFDPDQLKTGRKGSFYTFCKFAEIWLQKYTQSVETGDISKEYVEHLHRYNRLYWQPGLANWDIREIAGPVIDDFYLKLCRKPIGKKHVQNIMDGLHKLMNDAVKGVRGLEMPEFPKYKVKKKQTERGTWLKEGQQDLVLSFVPDIHKPIVTTGLYHGLRMSEIRDIRRKHLITESGRLALDVKTRKGGPDRVIVLDPKVARLIRSIPPTLKHDFLFHHHGIPYSKTTHWKIIRNALDKAGYPDITPNQAMRHSCASQLWQRGASAPEVQYMMGHSSITTTMIYSHVDPKQQERFGRGV